MKKLHSEISKIQENISEKISEDLHILEKKYIQEMTEEIKKLISDDVIVIDAEEFDPEYDIDDELIKDLSNQGFEEKEESMKFLIETFVNNTITQRSIWDDPSGDWDGKVRFSKMHVYFVTKGK